MIKRFFNKNGNSISTYKKLLNNNFYNSYGYKYNLYYYEIEKTEEFVIIDYRVKKVHPLDKILIDYSVSKTKYFYEDKLPEFIVNCKIHEGIKLPKNILKFLGIDWFPKKMLTDDYTFNSKLFFMALRKQITKPKDVYLLELEELEIPDNNIPLTLMIKFLNEDDFKNYKNKTSSYATLPFYLNLCKNPVDFFKITFLTL